MSIVTGSNPDPNTGPHMPSFHEQATLFLREKIKTARLAFPDVTPAQLLAEEVIHGNSPDSPTLYSISRAAFEAGDYWRIVGVLHRRLSRFDIGIWRVYYNSLIVLEHLLVHGPESVADEFRTDEDIITQCGAFQYIDEKGFNWGLVVRKKSDRVLKLLEKGLMLREERDGSRKLKRGIQGFGSFCVPTSAIPAAYVRCTSRFNPRSNESKEPDRQEEDYGTVEEGSKEKTVLREESAESKPLLVCKLDECRYDVDHHPFNDQEISHSSLEYDLGWTNSCDSYFYYKIH